MPNHYGSRIRDARLARGWTQTELAQRAFTTQARISDIERGRRRARAATRLHLAAALGIPEAELFHEDDDEDEAVAA